MTSSGGFYTRAQGVFRRFISVPVNRPERSFLQGRLEIYLTIVLCLWTLAFVIEQALSLALDGHLINFRGPRADAGAYILTFIGVVVLQAAMLALARSRPLSSAASRGIEMLVTLVMVSHACFTLAGRSLSVRPDMLMLHIATVYLMLRAAIMPETARSAAQSGFLVMALVLGATIFVHVRATGKLGNPELQEIVSQAVLAVVSVALTSTITFAIHGLRGKARAAMELGQYTLIEKIGEGGMGVVYRARHALLRRPTAVKVLASQPATGGPNARFEREVQLTADLSHPNIISVYDFGRSSDGAFYYAMEFVHGIDLQRLVEEDGAQPPARVVHILLQAADALAEAHEVNLIHRDVKPANLMLTNHDRRPDHLKVLDFGLAKDLRDDAQMNQSDVHAVLGTPLYMSPEAVVNPAEVDAQSDVYALGAVAYWLLSGVTPFKGATLVELVAHQLHEQPEPPSKHLREPVPPALEKLVLDCIAKSKAARPASAGALLGALRALDVGTWTADAANAWWQVRASRPPTLKTTPTPTLTRTLVVAPR